MYVERSMKTVKLREERLRQRRERDRLRTNEERQARVAVAFTFW